MELILTESDASLDPVSPSATDLSTDLDCVPDTDPRSFDVYAVPEDVADAKDLEVPLHIQDMAEMADELAVNPFLMQKITFNSLVLRNQFLSIIKKRWIFMLM